MSLDDYLTAWRAQGAAGYFPLHEDLNQVMDAMTRSHRKDRIVLGGCAVNSVVTFAAVVWMLLVRRPSSWEEVLPLLALEVALGVGLVILIRRHRQRRQAVETSTQSVLQATRTALSATAGQMRDFRLLLTLAAVTVPVLALVVNRLQAAGKMNMQAALSFGLVSTVILAVNAIVLTRKWKKLVSRSISLQKIMAALEFPGEVRPDFLNDLPTGGAE